MVGQDRTPQYKENSLSLVGAVALGTGVMIGAGIFALTGQMAEMTGYLEEKKLKPVYDALDGMYDYGTLRCVLAELE